MLCLQTARYLIKAVLAAQGGKAAGKAGAGSKIAYLADVVVRGAGVGGVIVQCIITLPL